MSVSILKTKDKSLGDVFQSLYHPAYCVESYKLVNPIAAEVDLENPCGQPVKASGGNRVFVQDTDEANATGLLMWDKPISFTASQTTDFPYPILVRGPAVINQDSLPTTDINGDAFTIATLVTAYAALSPKIIVQREPTKTSTQSD